MQLSHRPHAVSAGFDDPNLVSAAGLIPVAALAVAAGLRNLADVNCPGMAGEFIRWKDIEIPWHKPRGLYGAGFEGRL